MHCESDVDGDGDDVDDPDVGRGATVASHVLPAAGCSAPGLWPYETGCGALRLLAQALCVDTWFEFVADGPLPHARWEQWRNEVQNDFGVW